MPGILGLRDRDQRTGIRRQYEIGGQGKDSNLRYDLRRITALASRCLKPLSHLSSTSYFTQLVPNFGSTFVVSRSAIQPSPLAHSDIAAHFLTYFLCQRIII